MPRPTRTRHIAVAAIVGLVAVGTAAPASGEAGFQVHLQVSAFPAGYVEGGPSGVAASSTGSYSGYALLINDASHPPTRAEQMRDGKVVSYDGAYADRGHTRPVSIAVRRGDVFRLLSGRDGEVLAQTTFSGTPSLGPTTCVGSRAFAGSADAGVTVDQVQIERRTGSTTSTGTEPVRRFAPIATATPSSYGPLSFSGAFPSAARPGDALTVRQTRTTTSPYRDTHVSTSVTRPALGCPPPPAPAVPTPAPAPADASPSQDATAPRIGRPKVRTVRLRTFLRRGLRATVYVGEPGTVAQGLYLPRGGRVPATVRSARAAGTRRATRPVRIGRGHATARRRGKLSVRVRPTVAARAALRRARRPRLRLVTTARDAAGNARTVTTTVRLGR